MIDMQPIKKFDGTSKFNPQPKGEKVLKKPKPISKVRKPTGEGALFLQIGSKRQWRSFVSGAKIIDLTVSNMAHVLPKSTYPAFRLEERNIVILTASEHDVWDNSDRSSIRDNPQWQKLFELEEKLKAQYNKKHR